MAPTSSQSRSLKGSAAPAFSRAFGKVDDQFYDGAEDVELDLLIGSVANPHRAGAGVPGQGVDDGLRRQ